eukprot:6322671-Amphidinium_carterae.1
MTIYAFVHNKRLEVERRADTPKHNGSRARRQSGLDSPKTLAETTSPTAKVLVKILLSLQQAAQLHHPCN